MKKAKVPGSITLKNQFTGKAFQTVTFREYAYGHWFADKRWTNPPTNFEKFLKCKHEVDKKEGEMMAFEDEDHKLFAEIVRTSEHEQPLVYMQVQSYDTTILDAK